MYLEKIKVEDLKKFAEAEFGNVTSVKKFMHKKVNQVFYNIAFRLKANGAYEEAYFYDFDVYPIRVEDINDRHCDQITKRFRRFMSNHLSGEDKKQYDEKVAMKEVDISIYNF